MTTVVEDDIELKLQEEMEQFVDDPLGFVNFVFDWGEGDLIGETGPDVWQTEILELIGKGCLTVEAALQIAVRSGHGIGKTTLIAWLIIWFLSTRPHAQVVVTANTAAQLDTKTWRELAKWHKRAINAHWFEWTATKFYCKASPETWFAAAIPWSKARAQSFAGTHENYVLMIFDEASEIEDIIWETAEGAMTTTGAIWVVFGNPTQNTGRFAECFGKYRHRWITREIDSRTAKKANQAQIKQWIEDYGDDSDFVRVRVKGQSPRAGSLQFIGNDLVDAAQIRPMAIANYSFAPKIIGCDVARFGDDQSVITVRQGLKVLSQIKYRGLDTMQYASHIAETCKKYAVESPFVDVGGIGAGVVDRLKQLKYKPIEVNFGAQALNHKLYFNLRAEMWGKMRDWLKYGSIPQDNELRDDLIGPQYGFDAKERIQLEKKSGMKSRGVASPDCGDSLAITFAYPVALTGAGVATRPASASQRPSGAARA